MNASVGGAVAGGALDAGAPVGLCLGVGEKLAGQHLDQQGTRLRDDPRPNGRSLRLA